MQPTPLGTRLQSLRLKAGLSGRELARLAEISETLVSHIERGYVADPGTATTAALASVLGVSLDLLVHGKGTAPTDDDLQAAVTRARRRAKRRLARTGTEG